MHIKMTAEKLRATLMFCFFILISVDYRASSREALSSGFLTKQDKNEYPQLQRLARNLIFSS